jgi:hypothetical protein
LDWDSPWDGGRHMSVVGIVALSLLAGLFIALLIGVSGWLLWVGIQFRNTVSTTQATLAAHRTEWSTTLLSLGVTLETHRAEISKVIASINGAQLQKEVTHFSQLVNEQRISAQRLEIAANAITTCTKQWLSEGAFDDAPPVAGVDESGYAATRPGEPAYISHSRTAADDRAALAEESADVTQAE